MFIDGLDKRGDAMNDNIKHRVANYGRVSTEEQAKEGVSIDTQLSAELPMTVRGLNI